VLRIAALIAGTVTVGFWFGVVLALVVWLLPAAILWPLIKREHQHYGITPSRFRLGRSASLRLSLVFLALTGALLLVYGIHSH
jgi:hypothetical protein